MLQMGKAPRFCGHLYKSYMHAYGEGRGAGTSEWCLRVWGLIMPFPRIKTAQNYLMPDALFLEHRLLRVETNNPNRVILPFKGSCHSSVEF